MRTSRLPVSRLPVRGVLWAVVVTLLLSGAALLPQRFEAAASPNTFVTMPDGVKIAMNVRMPANFKPGRRYPTLFEMSGYDGGAADDGTLARDFAPEAPGLPQDDSRQLTRRFTDAYVTVHASVRGSGCSGGTFDLFSQLQAEDGRYIIDEWIAKQSWSNGDVALMGHSYSGITGFLIAARQPRHLRVATLSGLIDDLFRGVTNIGGVSNLGFPLLWTGAIRPFYDVAGGFAPGIVREEGADDQPERRRTCAQNQTTKSRTVIDDPILQGVVAGDVDNEWYRARSLVTYSSRIQVPLHVAGAYQDEQTGPRFAHLWETVKGVPKRMVMLNGDHNAQNPEYAGREVWGDRRAWVDHWMGLRRTPRFGTFRERRTSVTTLLEQHRNSTGELVSNGRIESRSFPLETTRWTTYFLRANNGLSTTRPLPGEGGTSYVSGLGRQSWVYQAGPTAGSEITTPDGPDQAAFRSGALGRDLTVAGPILATLWLQSTAPDTELFVQVNDVAPDGSRSLLQRGMLKASHRAIDTSRSDRVGGLIYRPHRPHTNPALITPGQATEYAIEVFPLGHVFRRGHQVEVVVTAPPRFDSYYAYVQRTLPAYNTVLTDPAHPSRILLPVVPTPRLGPELACGQQNQVRCIPA